MTNHQSEQDKTEELVEQVRDLLDGEDLKPALTLFGKLHPADQGDVIESLPVETQQEILAALTPEASADILEYLEPEEIAEVAGGVSDAVLSDILDETHPDVAADILRQLPDERAQDVLEDMEEADDVIPLLRYPDDTAGGRMVLEFVAVRASMTAQMALESIRSQGPDAKEIHSIFVVGPRKRLMGSVGITQLALAAPSKRIKEIMDTSVISVSAEAKQEEYARTMRHYNLDQLPVLDSSERLVGVILSKDVLDVLEEEATEDMYKLAGVTGERMFGPLKASVRNRLPWLFVNLGTTFLAAAVISIFESTIAKVVALAVFLPVVAGQGGIGGTQTLTLVVRSMALGDVPKAAGMRLLKREIILGVLHGLLLGLAVGIIAYVWKGNFVLGVVLSLAMLGNMLIAGFTGAGVPLLLNKLKVDPAVASAVIVTTCTDVFGFLLFLGLAALLVTSLL
jgi:magnesium transporter